MAALVGDDGTAVDKKTFRKWRKIFIQRIALLKYRVVSLFSASSFVKAVATSDDCCFTSLIACFGLSLLQIIWENRKVGDEGNDCLTSVDATDVPIPYQTSGSIPEAWYTKKFNASGLRYEIGVCILTGWIVWLMGPFPCGDWPDIVCFRYALKHMLDDGEWVEADDGYVGEDPATVKVPGSVLHDQDPQMLRV